MLRFARIAGLMVSMWLLFAPSAQAAQDAAAEFRQGHDRLAAGDLRGALQSYVAAVKADRANQEYLQQYLMVRQAITLQAAMSDRQDLAEWETKAQALRSFFVMQGLPAQTLPIDREIFARLKTADAAVQLADTLLQLDQFGEAEQVLKSLDAGRSTLGSRALLAIALARQNKMDDARRVGASVAIPTSGTVDPGTLYLLARMRAALGETDVAIGLLKRSFESVPPSRLDDLKTHAKSCADFGSASSGASFAAVLKTQSKVAESKCSGGSSCASCPMRGGCSKTPAK